MILLEQKLIAETPDSTASILMHGTKFLGFIIEDGHRAVKEYGKTRIPEGRYRIGALREGRFFDKYKAAYGHTWVPVLQSVPGFTGILIHIGNETSNTNGCLLVNNTIGYMDKSNQYYGRDSVMAYIRLYKYLDLYMGDEVIFIDIKRQPHLNAV